MNASYNGSGWVLDDTAKHAYFFKLDIRRITGYEDATDGMILYRVPPGGGAHTDEYPVFAVNDKKFSVGNLTSVFTHIANFGVFGKSGTVPFAVRADALQGTNIAEFQNSSAVVLAKITETGGAQFSASVTLSDGAHLISGTSTGTKIGTAATQKLGFFGASPIVRPEVLGSRGDSEALGNLLTVLQSLGLVKDSTT